MFADLGTGSRVERFRTARLASAAPKRGPSSGAAAAAWRASAARQTPRAVCSESLVRVVFYSMGVFCSLSPSFFVRVAFVLVSSKEKQMGPTAQRGPRNGTWGFWFGSSSLPGSMAWHCFGFPELLEDLESSNLSGGKACKRTFEGCGPIVRKLGLMLSCVPVYKRGVRGSFGDCHNCPIRVVKVYEVYHEANISPTAIPVNQRC